MRFTQIEKAISIIKKLRDPLKGCPWDLAQDHKSLTKYMIEEAYEYVYAVEQSPEKMKEELADVLLQVLLNAQIAEDEKRFSLEDVASELSKKMIHRHPHVFNNNQETKITAQDVREKWEEIKSKERLDTSFFKKEEAYLPSLIAAYKIGDKSKRVNFDWENVEQVFEKVKEEYEEVKVELNQKNRNIDKLEEEIGDLLFSTAQLARHLSIDPEESLRKANLKFIKRFNQLEKIAKNRKLDLQKLNVQELESLWQEVKTLNKTGPSQ